MEGTDDDGVQPAASASAGVRVGKHVQSEPDADGVAGRLQGLSEDVLLLIFSHLSASWLELGVCQATVAQVPLEAASSFAWVRTTLPLVCRRFASVLRESNPLWRSVFVSVSREVSLAWLARDGASSANGSGFHAAGGHSPGMAQYANNGASSLTMAGMLTGSGGSTTPNSTRTSTAALRGYPAAMLSGGGGSTHTLTHHHHSSQGLGSAGARGAPNDAVPSTPTTQAAPQRASLSISLLRAERVLQWVGSRARHCQVLWLDLSTPNHTFDARAIQQLLSLVKGSLRQLYLADSPGHGRLEGWDVLSTLKGLQRLHIQGIPQDFLHLTMPYLQSLPNLQTLSFRPDMAGYPLPAKLGTLPQRLGVLELAKLWLEQLPRPYNKAGTAQQLHLQQQQQQQQQQAGRGALTANGGGGRSNGTPSPRGTSGGAAAAAAAAVRGQGGLPAASAPIDAGAGSSSGAAAAAAAAPPPAQRTHSMPDAFLDVPSPPRQQQQHHSSSQQLLAAAAVAAAAAGSSASHHSSPSATPPPPPSASAQAAAGGLVLPLHTVRLTECHVSTSVLVCLATSPLRELHLHRCMRADVQQAPQLLLPNADLDARSFGSLALPSPSPLRALTLRACGLRRLGGALVAQLTALQSLDLGLNEELGLVTDCVPLELASLVHLTRLDLCGCGLVSLPAPVAALPSLVHLNLSLNALSGLPKQLACCGSLRALDISSNRLTSLPHCVWSMHRLRHLAVSSSPVAGEADFARLHELLPHLTHLQVKGSTHEARAVRKLLQLSTNVHKSGSALQIDVVVS